MTRKNKVLLMESKDKTLIPKWHRFWIPKSRLLSRIRALWVGKIVDQLTQLYISSKQPTTVSKWMLCLPLSKKMLSRAFQLLRKKEWCHQTAKQWSVSRSWSVALSLSSSKWRKCTRFTRLLCRWTSKIGFFWRTLQLLPSKLWMTRLTWWTSKTT